MSLRLALDRELPACLPADSATALFCVGSCFDAERRIERLQIVVNGVAHPVSAHGMPRPDVEAATGLPAAYLSGFWATLPLPARPHGSVSSIRVRAKLRGGAVTDAPLGAIAFIAAERRPTSRAGPIRPGTIAICMASFEPSLPLFEAQIESLRAQTDEDWICVISDDCSSKERLDEIFDVVGDDPRFTVSRSEQRQGFYRNFERALGMVPAGVELIALCDQDDRWHPDKLRTLRQALTSTGAILAYSDLRLVEADGRVLRGTFWRGRSNNTDNLASMVIANTITGAATLFRRELLDVAVPFPDTPGFQFHDHWLAVAALSAGEIAYVDRPLYDYVQHPGAVFGDVTHGPRRSEGRGLAPLVRRLSTRGTSRWRAAYFYGYVARETAAQTALIRSEERLTAGKRRALQRFIACDTSTVALMWLIARSLRGLFGHTETLGTEIELAQGLVWKRLLSLRARFWALVPRPRADASIPSAEAFVQKRLRRWRARL